MEKKQAKALWHRRYHVLKPIKKMLFAAKARAKQQGLEFSLKESDITIPDICPALGIPLVKSSGKLHSGSPTIDRLIPDLGYVPGNVMVISHRANRIKQDATLEELEAVAGWLRETQR